jgi:hypothetical protein
MYLIQSENDIPVQPMPNTAYYLIGREVRIYDSLGQLSVFTLKNDKAKEEQDALLNRLEKCEKKIDKVFRHLTSFVGEDTNG